MKRKEVPKLNLHFPEKGGVQPKGFKDINMNESVTVIVKGKVKSLSENADHWDPGKRFTLDISSCEIQGTQKKVTLSGALKNAQKKV